MHSPLKNDDPIIETTIQQKESQEILRENQPESEKK